jgi:hypothetical protein
MSDPEEPEVLTVEEFNDALEERFPRFAKTLGLVRRGDALLAALVFAGALAAALFWLV